MSDDIFVPPSDKTSSEIIGEMMQGANEKLAWAREKANEFLGYANELEERANSFRGLAAQMVSEALLYNEEVAMMITAEFPLDIPCDPGEEEVEIEVD